MVSGLPKKKRMSTQYWRMETDRGNSCRKLNKKKMASTYGTSRGGDSNLIDSFIFQGDGKVGIYRDIQAITQLEFENGETDTEMEQLLDPLSNKKETELLIRNQSIFCDNRVITSKYTIVTFIPRY